MATQPHPPPHRIPPPTLLIPKRNRRPRRVLALLRRLIPIIREINTPRTAVRPVPARAAWERGGFALVELVVVGLGRADGVWAGYGGQVGWDGDFADFAAGNVEQFRGDGGEGWAEGDAGAEVGLGDGGEAWVDGVVGRVVGGARDGEREAVRGGVGQRQVEVVWGCLRSGVLGYGSERVR